MTATPRVFHPVAQCSACFVRWGHDSNQFQSGYWYKWNNTTPPSSAELLNLATEVRDTIGVKMQQMTSTGARFREVYCRNMNTEIANQATAAFPTNASGTRGGDPTAASVAMEIVKRTGLTGHSSHGAVRISDFSEGDVSGNTLQSAIMGLAANLIVSLIAARVGGRFFPGVGSILHGTITQILTGIVLDSDSDSQKTRLNRHGST